ncbi:MAG: glucose-1-phosphate cytidylyltransferase [Candidatus Omnitrophica bacterium]|nr:glucose-1-phosphate cytidylyltransferase [Candidatus Omnitrophota bacterium]MBI3083484.1 glucose-1-phosphate cytidylyltransferase [Candidatus Omnitrophota bacterium]
MKVVILCGGLGTRLREETEYRPKPMVPIGGRPILWHIMNRYAAYGFHEFILCLGYKGEMIKDYFLRYRTHTSDFTLKLGLDGEAAVEYHSPSREREWSVTFVDTGERAMTGARIKRIERFIDGETFLLTYGDGLADINLSALLAFHRRHGRIATVTGVHPGSSRFGELALDGDRIVQFVEKPEAHDGYISGGFFVFQREFFRYVSEDDDCVLERKPLQQLTKDGQLMAYRHHGYWQCMDTYRDYQQLNEVWERGQAPWTVVVAPPATRRKRSRSFAQTSRAA